MTVTVPYQCEYNGLTVGPGSDVQLSSIAGLRGNAEIRGGNAVKPRRDGVWAGLDFLGSRIFTVDLEVFAPSDPFEDVVAAIGTAFQIIRDPAFQLPFEFLLPGWANSRQITCRPVNGDLPIDQWFQFNRAQIGVQLEASDPLIYDTVLKSASAGLPSPTAGLMFPVTFDVTFGASTGGSISVENAGNYITAPVITITGPVTNPTVAFTASGQFMTLGITLGVGDVLVIDMGARTVTLNGTASRANTIATGSTWWGIPPGTWSIGVASTDSAPVAATFLIEWYDAWEWM